MIGVIDYGVGNVQAFLNLYKRIGFDAKRVSEKEDLLNITHIILPGVGHFDHAMQKLNDSGLRSELEDLVLVKKIPIIGVCVGMQMLSDGSEEGNLPGLGWIPGYVRSMRNNSNFKDLRLPHMGWNKLSIDLKSSLFLNGFEKNPQFYFLHSYFFVAENRDDVVARVNFGIEFDAVVSSQNIHGIQCHPEKSHHWGENLLKNFKENI